VPNSKFITIVFGLLNTDLFSKSVNVIRRLLTKSIFTKALTNMGQNEALSMAGMTADDK
jgi:hypothetical protein